MQLLVTPASRRASANLRMGMDGHPKDGLPQGVPFAGNENDSSMTIRLVPANIRTSRPWVLGVSSGVFGKGEAIVSGGGQSLHDAVEAPRHSGWDD
jgi:hypothetical protein